MDASNSLAILTDCHQKETAQITSDQWEEAFTKALRAQLRTYEGIFLPHLGRGRRVHLPARNYQIGGRKFSADRQTFWFFDARSGADWLDVAVSYPMENIDDWMILFRPDQIPQKVSETLRPPLVPRLRKTLSARQWSIVDVSQGAEGNLELSDFLTIIDRHPWLKFDHRTDNGICIIETWSNRECRQKLRLDIDLQLQTGVCADFAPSATPLRIDPAWTLPKDDQKWIAVADILDDVYATLHRLIKSRFRLNTDHLGPLLFWRDWPDELFEFDESEDPAFLDLGLQMAAELNAPPLAISAVLDRWLQACMKSPRCRIPFLGELNTAVIPDLYSDSTDDDIFPTRIPGGPIYFAG